MSLTSHQLLNKNINSNIQSLLDVLSKEQIKSITISYNGGGDSGDTEEIQTIPPLSRHQLEKIIVDKKSFYRSCSNSKEDIQSFDEKENLFEAASSITLDILEKYYPGWEINEGSNGEFTINVPERTCYLQHNTFCTETTYHEYHY